MLRLPPEHARAGSVGGDAYDDGADRAARRRLADRLARRQGLTVESDWPMPILGVDCFVMVVPARETPTEAAAALASAPDVAWAQPLNAFHTQGGGGDPLDPAQPATRAWRLPELRRVATGRGVRVAVIDSRIDDHHPALLGAIVGEADFARPVATAPERHGTAVAGIVAARRDTGGAMGVAPDARLLAVRACRQMGPSLQAPTLCDSLSLARALQFAMERRARVINLSLSGPDDPLLAKLIDLALRGGGTVVAAVDRGAPRGGFPASHPGVVAVAESGPATGAAPHAVIAPGRDIPTTAPGGHWFLVSGDSYAAAHVSGLFALLGERSSRTMTAADIVLAANDGSVDACASLARFARTCVCVCATGAGPGGGLR